MPGRKPSPSFVPLDRSVPAEKTALPRHHDARTVSSASSRSKAARSAPSIGYVTVLRCSGRVNVTVATAPSTSTRTGSSTMTGGYGASEMRPVRLVRDAVITPARARVARAAATAS